MCVCLLQQTRESWQIVFFIAAGVYAVGGITFLVLASGTIQPWAIEKTQSTPGPEMLSGQVADSVDLRTQDVELAQIT